MKRIHFKELISRDFVTNTQLEMYCKTENIEHRSIDLLDKSMIIENINSYKKFDNN